MARTLKTLEGRTFCRKHPTRVLFPSIVETGRKTGCVECIAELKGMPLAKYREQQALVGRIYREELKDEVYRLLGNCCAKCGTSDRRVLQIDHVASDGAEDRAHLRNKNFYAHILGQAPDDRKAKYQLLCAECNWRKRELAGEDKRNTLYAMEAKRRSPRQLLDDWYKCAMLIAMLLELLLLLIIVWQGFRS